MTVLFLKYEKSKRFASLCCCGQLKDEREHGKNLGQSCGSDMLIGGFGGPTSRSEIL